MKYLVINGDDFGYSSAVNQAIISAHRQGVLTSASLMVTGEAFKEAVALAQEYPTLAVGLHLVLGCGKSVLPHETIPNLVDQEQNFLNDPLEAGLRYQFDAKAKEQLPYEICAQLEVFRSTGLSLSHVDGHLHHHVNPTVLNNILAFAREFNIKYIRLPYEELGLNLKIAPDKKIPKAIAAFVFSQLRKGHLEQLKTKNIGFADRVYGLLQTSNMTEEYLTKLIPKISASTVEIYTHPHLEGPGKIELDALLSDRVKEAIQSSGFELTNFTELASL